jgi:hypothetical protein
MSQYIPSIALVKTWHQLVGFSTEKEARNYSKRMINRNFGSIDLAIIYIEQNQPTQNQLINMVKICCSVPLRICKQ